MLKAVNRNITISLIYLPQLSTTCQLVVIIEIISVVIVARCEYFKITYILSRTKDTICVASYSRKLPYLLYLYSPILIVDQNILKLQLFYIFVILRTIIRKRITIARLRLLYPIRLLIYFLLSNIALKICILLLLHLIRSFVQGILRYA